MAGYQNDPGTTQQEAGFGFLGRYWTESFTDSIVALAGGGRPSASGAQVLASMFNRVTTVANASAPTLDSVLLPSVGNLLGGALSICVINATANPMQVFAQGSDTINGIAGSTGVPQMQNSTVWYTSFTAGVWTVQGLGSGQAGSQPTWSVTDALTAHSGGGQSSALAITTNTARFTTVAAPGDSAVLPPAQPGMAITVINAAAANIMNVFPASQTQGGVSGGDQINTLGQNNALAVPGGGAVVEFFCTVAGTWHTLISYSGANQQAYNAVSTVNASITLTGAQITGGSVEVTTDMTGTQAGAVTLTLPTVAALVTAMTVAGINPQAGFTYELDIIGRDGTHTYTVTTNTGWTLTGTMTITNQVRKFYLTLTSLTAATLRSVGTFTIGVA